VEVVQSRLCFCSYFPKDAIADQSVVDILDERLLADDARRQFICSRIHHQADLGPLEGAVEILAVNESPVTIEIGSR
jgi:hypothetical protein